MKNLITRWLNRGLATAAVLILSSANASVLAAGTASYHAPIVRLRHGTSTNWSGYAAYNGTFTSVSASWVQPALTCSTGDGYSSYWVGLDGYNSSTVEQLGTEGDCSGGQASFYAWYEMYPHPGYYINTITVHPGDSMRASVTSVRGTFTLSLSDTSTGKSFSTTQKMNQAKLSSAEVVLEAPWNGGVLPLDNFGTAYFTNSLANGKPLGGFSNLDPITMINPYGMDAVPSSFDTTKTSFSVTWKAKL